MMLVEAWGLEFVKGFGRFFMQPLLYYAFFLAWLLGLLRVKRERKDFHVRVYDSLLEWRSLFSLGIWLGLLLSLVTIGVGTVVTSDTIALIAWSTVLLSLTLQVRFLSPAYTFSVAIFATSFLARSEWTKSLFANWFPTLAEANVTTLALLLSSLLVIEAILIEKYGGRKTSPRLTVSKRGLVIGEHLAQKLWLVPVLLLVPGEGLRSFVSWWPVFSLGEQTYSLMLVPFLLGFSQRAQTMHPAALAKWTGRRVLLFALLLLLLAISSYWFKPFAIVVAALAMIGREWISLSARLYEQQRSPYFTKRKDGLVILGILPATPAEKMALQVGEVIAKVNGMSVQTESQFYEALQRNRAFCKLEVLNEDGEVRFVQSTWYEGEHHELGLLFVQDERANSNVG
jgi:hypothetical protein